ncbi:MAG TPA: AmmeMemoRadiSam system protein A, partial [Rhodocyclaceae bacterium]|nr:AmmeMemoRadiSam system protein A [Rhodocyclaceae bacterium]
MPATDALGPVLLAHARAAIADALGLPHAPAPEDPRLSERRASFVTLTRNGELRGCIGSLSAHRPLGEDVRANAVAAALKDSRFPPLDAREFDAVRVEVSVLTAPEFLEFRDEADALSQLVPGRDGVIFFNGCQKAT